MSWEDVHLSQVAPWNSRLRNPYRTRWTEAGGRYFRVAAVSLRGSWDVDEVNADGEYVDYVGCSDDLAGCRELIALHVEA